MQMFKVLSCFVQLIKLCCQSGRVVVSLFDDKLGRFYIKAAQIIHNIPKNKYVDHQTLSLVK